MTEETLEGLAVEFLQRYPLKYHKRANANFALVLDGVAVSPGGVRDWVESWLIFDRADLPHAPHYAPSVIDKVWSTIKKKAK
ncbi:MAG TPA: hypothetical protein VHZ24_00735 [Pirellulales bacterium]|jgi:hypothetical protein|nr:hypothetical protein [Pirellulales bacterium]